MPVNGFTTCVIGTYSTLTDRFTATLDLNDRATYYLDALTVKPFTRVLVSSFNVRTVGEPIYRQQVKNRDIEVTLFIKAASTSALDAALSALLQAVEGSLPTTPYVLQLKRPNGTTTKYSTVRSVDYDIPVSAREYLALAIGGKTRCRLTFHCAPYAFTARQWLANAVTNPGFEAPSGPGVAVFNDSLTTANAYATATAMTYTQQVQLLRPYHYFRLGDAVASATALDSVNATTGTVTGTVTFGQTGGLSGDATTAALFNGTTGYVTETGATFSTGNLPWSISLLVKVASLPSALAMMVRFGSSGTNTSVDFAFNASGKLTIGFGGGASLTQTSASLTTGVYHRLVATYDGTTVRLYIDGALDNSAALTAGAVSGTNIWIGAAAGSFAFAGTLQEVAIFTTTLTAQAVADLNTLALGTFSPGARSVAANLLTVSHGTTVAFGSPAWGAVNKWQVRFQYTTNMYAGCVLHQTDAKNYLAATVGTTFLTIIQVIAGVAYTLATNPYSALTNGNFYWLQVAQFPSRAGNPPSVAGNPPYVQASLYQDSGPGSIGAQVGATAASATHDAATALIGRPVFAASGANLVVGGAFSNVHTCTLFGPGGWSFTTMQNSATGFAIGAWDTTWGNPTVSSPTTYPSGPVTSFGAARFDLSPAGTVDGLLQLYPSPGGTPAGTYAIPVQTATNVLGYSVMVKETGLNAAATLAVVITEYNAAGTATGSASGNLGALTGGALPTNWTTIAGSYTTHANCAYVDFAVRVVDTAVAGESANAAVWIDNAQVWDQTRTGMATMSYHELTFPQSPAQLMVSGLVGDVPAPIALSIQGWLSSWPSSDGITCIVGRRAQVDPGAQLIGVATDGGAIMTLDSTSYGGCYASVASCGLWDIFPFGFPIASTVMGVFRLYGRMLSKLSAGSLAKFYVSPIVFESQGQTVAPTVAPITASNTWTAGDTGMITIPIGLLGALGDPTANSASVVEVMTDQNSPQIPQQANANWFLLMPVDAETAVTATSYMNSGTNSWWSIYLDGLSSVNGPAAKWSQESAPIPNFTSSSVGSTNAANNRLGLNSTASQTLHVDPTLKCNGVGVNQIAMSFTNSVLGCYPVACELIYSPFYLFPL